MKVSAKQWRALKVTWRKGSGLSEANFQHETTLVSKIDEEILMKGDNTLDTEQCTLSCDKDKSTE